MHGEHGGSFWWVTRLPNRPVSEARSPLASVGGLFLCPEAGFEAGIEEAVPFEEYFEELRGFFGGCAERNLRKAQ
jgi:hypothetical protein